MFVSTLLRPELLGRYTSGRPGAVRHRDHFLRLPPDSAHRAGARGPARLAQHGPVRLGPSACRSRITNEGRRGEGLWPAPKVRASGRFVRALRTTRACKSVSVKHFDSPSGVLFENLCPDRRQCHSVAFLSIPIQQAAAREPERELARKKHAPRCQPCVANLSTRRRNPRCQRASPRLQPAGSR